MNAGFALTENLVAPVSAPGLSRMPRTMQENNISTVQRDSYVAISDSDFDEPPLEWCWHFSSPPAKISECACNGKN
ncbi:hypothetical protein AcW1_003938 [Taiwanofungus camphoratus]|nr:hypothetical protein AcW1_003938 [Antrodia cinnamomea]